MEVKMNTSTGADVRQKIERLLDQANSKENWTCFATVNENGYPELREMGIILRDGLKVYLVSAKGTCKVQQIKHNNKVCLRAFSPEYSESVNLFGTAKLHENEAKRQWFWEKAPDMLAEYFHGPNDPEIEVIEILPDYLEYVSHAKKAQESKIRLLMS